MCCLDSDAFLSGLLGLQEIFMTQLSFVHGEFSANQQRKNVLSSWRRVVELVGRRYNLASSGQISYASSKFGIKKAKNVLSSCRRVVKLVGRR